LNHEWKSAIIMFNFSSSWINKLIYFTHYLTLFDADEHCSAFPGTRVVPSVWHATCLYTQVVGFTMSVSLQRYQHGDREVTGTRQTGVL